MTLQVQLFTRKFDQ